MPKFNNLTGKVFGMLTILKQVNNSTNNKTRWLCKCNCGNEKIIVGASLLNRKTISCGCYRQQQLKIGMQIKHGLRKHPLYSTWKHMIDRCYDATHSSYKNYGGRGITVCERWHKIENFINDIGDKPINHTVGRIENNGNYEPINVRWETPHQQNRNRRDNVYVIFK